MVVVLQEQNKHALLYLEDDSKIKNKKIKHSLITALLLKLRLSHIGAKLSVTKSSIDVDL